MPRSTKVYENIYGVPPTFDTATFDMATRQWRKKTPDSSSIVPPSTGTRIAPSPLSTNYPLAAPFAPPPAEDKPLTPEAQQTAETVAQQQVSSSLSGQTFAPLLETLHGIGRPTIAPFAPVAPRFEGQAPVATRRPDSSYYQNLFSAKAMPLGQEYFGRGGLSDQAVGEASRRGLLTAGPSGVAGQLYEKTIANPYARELANIQNQVNIIKTETEMDLAKYDVTRQDDFRKFQADLILKDRDYGVASVEAQARVDNTYLALESEINSAIASGATQEELANLNARVNTFQALVAAETAKTQLNQQAAQEAARLEEEIRNRQNRTWIDLISTPGALPEGYTVPYGELDVPIPPIVGPDTVVRSGSSSGEGSPPVSSNPDGYTSASPGKNGAPSFEGTRDRQQAMGSDGQLWTWSSTLGKWVR